MRDVVALGAALQGLNEGQVEIYEVALWDAVWYDTSSVLFRAVDIRRKNADVIFDLNGVRY